MSGRISMIHLKFLFQLIKCNGVLYFSYTADGEWGGVGRDSLYHHFTWDQVKMTSGGGSDSEQDEDREEDRGKQTCIMCLLDFPA